MAQSISSDDEDTGAAKETEREGEAERRWLLHEIPVQLCAAVLAQAMAELSLGVPPTSMIAAEHSAASRIIVIDRSRCVANQLTSMACLAL